MGLLDFIKGKPEEEPPKFYIQYSGGSGTSKEDAIVITAEPPFLGVTAEYDYIESKYGQNGVDYTLESQFLLNDPNGTHYDLFIIKLKDGATVDLYFDITSFFGRRE